MRRGLWSVALDVALVCAVVLGVSGFAHSDSQVTVVVDGTAQHVGTFSNDVAAVLAETGVEVSARDTVVPALDSPVPDGATITVAHARPMSLTIDGKPMQVWTTATTVEAAMAQLSFGTQSAELSVPSDDRVPMSGLDVGVRLPDRVVVVHDGSRTSLVTMASSVAGVLRQIHVELGRHDRIDVPLGGEPTSGEVITVVRVSVAQVTRGFVLEPQTIKQPDSSLLEGTVEVDRRGSPGRGVVVYRVVRHDGVVVGRDAISRHVFLEPVSRVVRYGTKQRLPAPSTGDGLNWSALAHCESGGNPRAVNSAGYYGLYQFALSTWYSVGGQGNPIDATSQEQTYRAQILYQRAGSSPWPTCGYLLYT